MNADTCEHPKKFFALADGCRVREATRDEALAWVAGQTHPLFSVGAGPNWLCFDKNVRVGSNTVTREVDECLCPRQPYMD